jgi:polyhydroxyalkanoate synthesis regulator phasin
LSCKHYKYKLEEEDRYFVNSEEHNNCCLCLVDDKGPLTQEEIGKYLGYTKMRICQIEKRAVEKLQKRIHNFVEKEDVVKALEEMSTTTTSVVPLKKKDNLLHN